jgi:hypothetical protein
MPRARVAVIAAYLNKGMLVRLGSPEPTSATRPTPLLDSGDKLADLQADHHAGLRGGLHVLTGTGAGERPTVAEWTPENFELRLGDSIRDVEGLLQ